MICMRSTITLITAYNIYNITVFLITPLLFTELPYNLFQVFLIAQYCYLLNLFIFILLACKLMVTNNIVLPRLALLSSLNNIVALLLLSPRTPSTYAQTILLPDLGPERETLLCVHTNARHWS